jgi:hypothetical protein
MGYFILALNGTNTNKLSFLIIFIISGFSYLIKFFPLFLVGKI